MTETLLPRPPLAAVAARLVDLANVHPRMKVFVPNGKCDELVDAIHAVGPGVLLTLDPRNVVLVPRGAAEFDRVILLGPASMDTWQVYAGLRFLAAGGGLVAVMDAEVETSRERGHPEFRRFVESRGGWFEPIDPARGAVQHQVIVRIPAGGR